MQYELNRALNKIPQKQREAIVWYEISGLSMEEIAKLQNLSVAGVKTNIHRARKTLSQLLEDKEEAKDVVSETILIGLSPAQFDAALQDRCAPEAPYRGLASLRARLNSAGDGPREGRENRELFELRWPRKAIIEVGISESSNDSVNVLLYFRDVTAEVEVERLKSEFLSTAAHELRTPMASVYGFAELLLNNDFDQQTQHDLLTTIYEQSGLLVQIINELLDLARMKWMMGWMHDTLDYFKMDPIFRQFHQDKFSFSMMYFYDENFMLPLSHDEVVHGKSPMIYKMPGDEWQKFANLRILYTYMFTHPGAKLLFMGNEFGATNEWNYKSELQWELLQHVSHGGMKYCVQQLNQLYKSEPALYEKQFEPGGFEWVDLNHRSDSVMVYKPRGKTESPHEPLL